MRAKTKTCIGDSAAHKPRALTWEPLHPRLAVDSEWGWGVPVGLHIILNHTTVRHDNELNAPLTVVSLPDSAPFPCMDPDNAPRLSAITEKAGQGQRYSNPNRSSSGEGEPGLPVVTGKFLEVELAAHTHPPTHTHTRARARPLRSGGIR